MNSLESERLAAHLAPFVGARSAWIDTYAAAISRSDAEADPGVVAELALAAWRMNGWAHPAVIASLDHESAAGR